MRLTSLLFLVILGSINFVQCVNIFTLLPTFSHSHYVLAFPLLKELSETGHNLTVVTFKSLGYTSPTYAEIVPDVPKKVSDVFNDFAKSAFENSDKHQFSGFMNFSTFAKDSSLALYRSTQMQDLLKSGVKFELMITEVFGAEALMGLATQLNVPVVGISTLRSNPWVQAVTGTPIPTSFVPFVMGSLPREMNFINRVKNAVHYLMFELIAYVFFDKPYQEAYDIIWPNAKLSYKEQKTNFSLVLMNSHISVDGPQPLMTNIIEVGGMQVNTKTKNLPADIKEFLDSAINGAILFSLGSNLDAGMMNPAQRDAIVKVLASQNRKVILKWDHPESVAEQVQSGKFYVTKWLPQSDILAHKNIKLFIMHGGLGGLTETVYHGVPVVVLPIFADQHKNADVAQIDYGIGVRLDYKNLTQSSFKWAVEEVLANPTYSETAKTLSILYRDRPQNSLETAKFWVEYVIRHKGAHFLKSPAIKLNYFQYYSLDVYTFLVFIVVLALYLIKIALKWVFRKLFVRTKTKKD